MIVMTRSQRSAPVEGSTAFEQFVATNARALLRLATVLTADPSAAQDVVQAVLERAFRDWARISTLQHRDAYVRRMITNEALTLRRRARRIVLTDAVPESAAPDKTVRVGDEDELIQAVRRLPPKQRAAVVLRYFDDLPDADIAAALGCREVTVRGYVLRGLRRLRVDLDPSEIEPPGEPRRPLAFRRHQEER